MKKTALLISTALLFSSLAYADGLPKWDYKGKNSPDNWGKISPEFSACAVGKSQSPINITDISKSDNSPKITFSYNLTPKIEIDDGRTIEVVYNKGPYIDINDDRYDLTQFHFHSPSEHLLKGKQYPLEMHLVHQDKDGKLVVVAIWFKEGKENKILDTVWKKMPQKAGERVKVSDIDLQKLMPKNPHFYHYVGSLTTPPCTEGVSWFILKEPLEVSKAQIEKFRNTLKEANNRPTQQLNGRKVTEQ